MIRDLSSIFYKHYLYSDCYFPDLLHPIKMAAQLQQSQATTGVHEVEAEDTFQVFWKFAVT